MASRKFKVTDTDRGYRQLKKELSQLAHGKSYVKVGVIGMQAAAPASQGLTEAQLAAIQEFGVPSKGIPSRPFIRGTFDKQRGEYIALMRDYMPLIYTSRGKVRTFLNVLGMQMVTDIKNAVYEGSGIPPPNAPATARKKRKGKKGIIRPLIDTGRLIGAVQYEVVISGAPAPSGEKG